MNVSAGIVFTGANKYKLRTGVGARPETQIPIVLPISKLYGFKGGEVKMVKFMKKLCFIAKSYNF